MTEQEAEAVRLERVWGVGATEIGYGTFRLVLPDNCLLRIWHEWSGRFFRFTDGTNVYLMCFPDGDIEVGGLLNIIPGEAEDTSEQELAQFAAQWMDSFRRNCWLSGADIEANAHEKAEWIQGFTAEELEAWSLKM